MTEDHTALHHLRIQGDDLHGARAHIWIDGQETHTITSLDLRLDPAKVNEATISVILPNGVDVDIHAAIRVNEQTSALLAKLGWISPERLHEALCQGEISINTARALNGLEPWLFPEGALDASFSQVSPEEMSDMERRFAAAVASGAIPKWIPPADEGRPMNPKDFHAAKLEAAGTDRLVEWDSLPEPERLMRYGKCGCGTPLAARTVTSCDDVLGVMVDYQAACPACACDESGVER